MSEVKTPRTDAAKRLVINEHRNPIGGGREEPYEAVDAETCSAIETELARYQQAEMPKEPEYLRLRNGFWSNPNGDDVPTYGNYVLQKDYLSLRARLARVTAELSEAKAAQERATQSGVVWQAEWTSISQIAKELKVRAESAERRLAECERDAERLNWLEADSTRMCDLCDNLHRFDTMRKNIDAAIAKEESHDREDQPASRRNEREEYDCLRPAIRRNRRAVRNSASAAIHLYCILDMGRLMTSIVEAVKELCARKCEEECIRHPVNSTAYNIVAKCMDAIRALTPDELAAVGKREPSQEDVLMLHDKLWNLHEAAAGKREAEHVAWLRYIEQPNKTRIQLCDSDDTGAFKVYRHAAPIAPDEGKEDVSDADIDLIAKSVGIKTDPAFGEIWTGNIQLRRFARAILDRAYGVKP